MISSLKSKLCGAFEPVASAYHGWRHFNRCVPAEEQAFLAPRKTMVEALVFQGTAFTVVGASGLVQDGGQALTSLGMCALTVGSLSSTFMVKTLCTYARQEKSRRQRLDAFKR